MRHLLTSLPFCAVGATHKAWLRKVFELYHLDLNYDGIRKLANFGTTMPHIVGAISELSVHCVDERWDEWDLVATISASCGATESPSERMVSPDGSHEPVSGSLSDAGAGDELPSPARAHDSLELAPISASHSRCHNRVQPLLHAIRHLENLPMVRFLTTREDIKRYDDQRDDDEPHELENKRYDAWLYELYTISDQFSFLVWCLEVARIRPKKLIAHGFRQMNRIGILSCHALPYLQNTLSEVEKLELEILMKDARIAGSLSQDGTVNTIAVNLARGLNHMCDTLRVLELALSPEDLVASSVVFHGLAARVRLPHLQVLTLRRICCFTSHFVRFLSEHSSTLQRNPLLYVMFRTPNTCDDGDFGDVLRILQGCLDLEYFKAQRMETDTHHIRFPGATYPHTSDLRGDDDGFVDVYPGSYVELENRYEVVPGLQTMIECKKAKVPVYVD